MNVMNAINPVEIAASSNQLGSSESPLLNRARLYHFFELALAHPGEDGFDYFRLESTEKDFLEVFGGLFGTEQDLSVNGQLSARTFFSRLRNASYQDMEAAHIALFSANYPHLPCPPYGSLYTATDSNKRLEEMLEIKQFYHQDGVDIADTFNDLPDHLCVELEFLQLLCFREDEMATKGDGEVLAGIRCRQAMFLDRFLLPLSNGLADHAAAAMPENLYSNLLEVMRSFLSQHRRDLEASVEFESQVQENPS